MLATTLLSANDACFSVGSVTSIRSFLSTAGISIVAVVLHAATNIIDATARSLGLILRLRVDLFRPDDGVHEADREPQNGYGTGSAAFSNDTRIVRSTDERCKQRR